MASLFFMKKFILLILLTSAGTAYSQTFNMNPTRFLLYFTAAGIAQYAAEQYDNKYTTLPDSDFLQELDRDKIWNLDRHLLRPYSSENEKWSKYVTGGLVASAIAISYDDYEFWDNMRVFSTILMTQSAVAQWTKTLSKRSRPYLYYDDTPEDLKYKRRAKHSFYSHHTSISFASATYAYYYYYQTQRSNWQLAALLYGGAVTAGVLRINSGEHFLSDVIVGALMGSSISYLICRAHTSDQIQFLLSPTSMKLSLFF